MISDKQLVYIDIKTLLRKKKDWEKVNKSETEWGKNQTKQE